MRNGFLLIVKYAKVIIFLAFALNVVDNDKIVIFN